MYLNHVAAVRAPWTKQFELPEEVAFMLHVSKLRPKRATNRTDDRSSAQKCQHYISPSLLGLAMTLAIV